MTPTHPLIFPRTEREAPEFDDVPPPDASDTGNPPDPTAHDLVTTITTAMLDELAQLAAQIADLIKEVHARRDLIAEAIRTHAQFAEAVVAHKRIIADAMVKIRAEFEQSKTELPPAPPDLE